MIPSIAPGRVAPRMSRTNSIAKGKVAVKYAAWKERGNTVSRTQLAHFYGVRTKYKNAQLQSAISS